MPITINLAHLLADRGIKSVELAERIGLSVINLSRLKQGHVKAIRFSTLEAICRELDCKPGDILDYVPENESPTHAREHHKEDPEDNLGL